MFAAYMYHVKKMMYVLWLFLCIFSCTDLSQSITKPTTCLWAQRRLKSAWASDQSYQRPCCMYMLEECMCPYLWNAQRRLDNQTGQMPRLIWVFAGCWFCRGPFHFTARPFQGVPWNDNGKEGIHFRGRGAIFPKACFRAAVKVGLNFWYLIS